MTQAELRQKVRELERLRDEIAGKVAEKIHERERLDEKIASKKDRDPKSEKRRNQLHEELFALSRARAITTNRLRDLRTRRQRVTDKAKELSSRIRSTFKPRIVDLNLSFTSLSPQIPIARTIGHYTAGPVDTSDADAERLCRQYHAYHLSKGWAGEAYCVNFTRNGTILLLRPVTAIGAHTYNYNTGSAGPMVHGTTGHTWTKAQLRAYKWWLRKAHTSALPPEHRANRDLSKVTHGCHFDYGSTACPGNFASGFRNP